MIDSPDPPAATPPAKTPTLDLSDTAALRMDETAATSEPNVAREPTVKLDGNRSSQQPADRLSLPGSGDILHSYEVVRSLGKGGMGHVMLARDIRLGRLVALKFLTGHSQEFGRRFLIEARATATLNHENIVSLHDIAQHGNTPYMVLEYVRGQSMDQWLEVRDPDPASDPGGDDDPVAALAPGRAVELIIPVVRALMCAHRANIVHRDLKPSNIMMGEDGSVKVFDFGLAKVHAPAQAATHQTANRTATLTTGPDSLAATQTAKRMKTGPGSPADLHSTRAGTIMGTMTHMAPEQWRAEAADQRADLWAVGIILFHLVTGHHPLAPLTRERLETVANPHLPMPRLSELRPDIGKLGELVDRCLIKERDDRMGSAEELLRALESLVRNQPHSGALARENDNPFTGLAAFQESDADRFYGCDQAVRYAVTRLAEQPLVTVVGPSGAGKSSFVRAGVIPALKRAHLYEAFFVRPGRRPMLALAQLLLAHRWQTSAIDRTIDRTSNPTVNRRPHDQDELDLQQADPEQVSARLRAEPGFLGLILRRWARRKRTQIALVLDQFEELYTLGPAEDHAPFLQSITALADDISSPVRVIIIMRIDFLDRVTGDGSAANQTITRGLTPLWTMNRDKLRRALTAPLDAVDHSFEDEQMVTDILDELESTTGALPLLQFTAARLWDARDRKRRVLTTASYRELGGVGGALARHADTVIAAMTRIEERWARTLLTRLVTPERTRAIVSLAELRQLVRAPDAGRDIPSDCAAALEHVLERLVAARLLTVEGKGQDDSTVELVHESLIHRWPTLDRWLNASSEDAAFVARVRSAAAEWQRGDRRDGLLWRGDAADEAAMWYRRQRERADRSAGQDSLAGITGITARDQQFLRAVIDLDTRARRRRRLFAGGTIAFLAAVAIVVSVLAVTAYRHSIRANEQAAEADRLAHLATGESLAARNASRMAAAREQIADPTLVLSLVRELEPSHLPQRWHELALWALNQTLSESVLPHGDEVSHIAFSPDGTRVVTTSHDRMARVWNIADPERPIVLRGHDNWVNKAHFGPDGARVLTASKDLTARIWNADGTGQPTVLRGHTAELWDAKFSADGTRILTASRDQTARIWNADGTGQPTILRGHTSGVYHGAFTPDGARAVTLAFDHTARVWDVPARSDSSSDGSGDALGQPLVITGYDNGYHAGFMSADGTRIAIVTDNRSARVVTLDGSRPPVVLRGHDDDLTCVAISRDGTRVVTGSHDHTVRVWNADGSGQPVILRGHQDHVMAVDFSPDGQRVVSTGHDKVTRVWRADGTGRPLLLRGHSIQGSSVAFSPDGTRLGTASQDQSARIWHLSASRQPQALRGHTKRISSALYSPDGTRVVTASRDDTARIHRADGSGAAIVLRGHESYLNSASFSADGTRVVTASRDGTARVWNADGTGEAIILRGHENGVLGATFDSDGERVVTASWDQNVRIHDVTGQRPPVILRGHEDGVFTAAFSPDGRRVVSASWDQTARVWNADGTGEPIVLRGHESGVYTATFSPDGQYILTTSADKTALLHRADGSGRPRPLLGHRARVMAGAIGLGAFHPDGDRVVTLSNDETLRIWDLRGLTRPMVIEVPDLEAKSAVFSPDGTRVLTASHQMTIDNGEVTEHAAWVWTELRPLTGLDDPRLWRATRYCPSVPLRVELLGIPEERASEQRADCLRRVAAARR